MRLSPIVPVLLAAFAFVLLFPSSPAFQPVPSRDSGVFLYIGDLLLSGGLPYRDVWDHKPPLIYVVNALGLWLGGGSRWGVWGLEWAFLTAALVLGYQAFKRAFGLGPALVATAAWGLAMPRALEWGNFTEEYTLPFKFGALLAFGFWLRRGPSAWPAVAIGATGALAFLAKPNAIGLHLALVVAIASTHLLARAWRPLLRDAGWVAAGALAICLPVGVYFHALGLWGAFLDQVFVFNGTYGLPSWNDKLASAQGGLRLYGGLAGAGLAAVAAWALLGRGEPFARWGWVAVGALAFGLEVALSSLSGVSYRHYYLTWLPALATLVAALAYLLSKPRGAFAWRALSGALLAAIMLPAMLQPARELKASWTHMLQPRPAPAPSLAERAAGLARSATRPDETVLVWGAEAVVNYLADRRAPTALVYQMPLFAARYRQSECARTFLAELERRPPALIVDTSGTNAFIPPLDPTARQAWLEAPERQARFRQFHRSVPPELEALYALVAERYRLERTVGPWRIYAARVQGGHPPSREQVRS